MTNAERQKRYRDKKRGGPPVGRWPAAKILREARKALRLGRTMYYMFKWINTHARDLVPDLHADLLKITPTYKRLTREYQAVVFQAIASEPADSDKQLVISRRDGQFVFEWLE